MGGTVRNQVNAHKRLKKLLTYMKQAFIYVLIIMPYLAGWVAGLVISLGRLWWAAFTQGYEDVAK